MSKWRPVELNCIYVIPDIHGMYNQLRLILSRILPLRKSDGGRDQIIFLGDYIDRHTNSHKVIDLLIDLKQKYGDQIKFLRGNHEMLLLEGIKHSVVSKDYLNWMNNGGDLTLKGYLDRAGIKLDNPFVFPRERISSIIPEEHIDFYKTCLLFYETDDYIFVHGGCDPFIPMKSQEPNLLTWDRSLYKFCTRNAILPWSKTIVTGHNTNDYGVPYIRDKFMMLDISQTRSLLVYEMRSGTGYIASEGNKRLVKMT